MPLLEVKNVSKEGPGDFSLNDISFSQRKLEKIGIAGETGAGKSTLLKLVAGLLQPDAGELIFDKERIQGPADQLVPGHPQIAYLSQQFELQKSLRVEQVLSYANQLSDRESRGLFDICEISHLLSRRTDELSGGEKQRVAICRLLISKPSLLLLDEPYAHLDMVHKQALKDVVRNIGQKLKLSCMLVSHDPMDTLSWADKMIILRNGNIVQTGTPEEVYYRPVDEYTGGLFGKYNVIEPEHFRTFTRLPAVKVFLRQEKGIVFVRPEQFRLVRRRDTALRGVVDDVRFYGMFSEADVQVSKKRVVIRTYGTTLEPGQVVYLSVGKEGLWRLRR